MGIHIKNPVKSIKKAVKKATGLVKSVVKSPINAVSSLVKGDLIGAATNLVNAVSMGTIDATGGNKGIVNINTNKYIAKAMGVDDLGASGVGSVVVPVTTYKKGKSGLVTQLRKGKGSVGGGSYSEIAKNPLGGSSGVTGR